MSVEQSSQKVEAQFFDVIQDRRSVRYYDSEVKISRDEMKDILQLATLAPSGANLQPWRFLVIDSQELKQKLLPIANSQQQVIEASAVIAILGDLEGYKLAGKFTGWRSMRGTCLKRQLNHSWSDTKDCSRVCLQKMYSEKYLLIVDWYPCS